MEKIKKLDDIKNMVFEIVNADKFRNHQNCVTYNSRRGGFSIEFNELQKVTIPNNGYIHTIDTNNMVLLEFEDTLGTTDWLPLAMFDDKIINSLYEVIKDFHKEMDIKKCFILCCDWKMSNEGSRDIVRVFDNKEKAQAYYNEFLTNECISTWLCNFVDENGNLNDDSVNDVDVYEWKENELFRLSHKGWYTEIYIEEMVVY
jgi:hypothetical protein